MREASRKDAFLGSGAVLFIFQIYSCILVTVKIVTNVYE